MLVIEHYWWYYWLHSKVSDYASVGTPRRCPGAAGPDKRSTNVHLINTTACNALKTWYIVEKELIYILRRFEALTHPKFVASYPAFTSTSKTVQSIRPSVGEYPYKRSDMIMLTILEEPYIMRWKCDILYEEGISTFLEHLKLVPIPSSEQLMIWYKSIAARRAERLVHGSGRAQL